MNMGKSIERLAQEQPTPSNREWSEFAEISEPGRRETEIVKPDISLIETTSPTALFEQNRAKDIQSLVKHEHQNGTDETLRSGLSEEEKAKVREAHPDYPDEITESIGSWQEYEIYDKANLKAAYVNDKPCLIRDDIDMDQKDVRGRTNRERMELGLAPLDENGRPIELHHIGQKADSPLAELTFEEHRGNGNDSILHDKNKETEVHGEGNNWHQERARHWETRSTMD